MEYVFYDVDKIKDFVFDSFKPKGVKGASELLKALDFDLYTKRKEHLLQALTEKFNIPDDRIIFSKGGSGLLKTTTDNGKEICDWLENKFKVHTKGGSLTAVFHKEEEADFPTSFAILNLKAREKKSAKLMTHDLSVTIFNDDEKDRCAYCGKRKSNDTIPVENERIPICEICSLKRNTIGTNDKAQAETLEDICKAPGLPDTRYILVVYGDLNEAGAHLSEMKSEEELQRFSNGISNTLDHARSEIENALEQKGFKFLAPVIGGDDIILFTHPASFELIKDQLFQIESKLKDTVGLKMNFSFLLAKHKFPIYHLFKLSQSILDLTKDLYYEDSRKQTRYGFFKVMEGNYRVSNEDVYTDKDFIFLFDIAKRVHENKDIHTSALYNILELLANDRSLPEKELNLDYFLSRHREFKEYILADNSDFQLIQREGKIKLTPDVLEDLIIMKDLLYKPGEIERRNHDQ